MTKNVIHIEHVYEFGTMFNKGNLKQVKSTKRNQVTKLYACKLGTILQLWLMSKTKEHYYCPPLYIMYLLTTSSAYFLLTNFVKIIISDQEF